MLQMLTSMEVRLHESLAQVRCALVYLSAVGGGVHGQPQGACKGAAEHLTIQFALWRLLSNGSVCARTAAA